MNIMKLVLQSISSSEIVARAAITAFVAQVNPTIDEVANIKTAVSEAVSNCNLSAYPNKVGPIYITAALADKGDDKELAIIVRDRGIGIADVERARLPLYTELSDDHSGMGFTIMESFMDSVKVHSTVGKGTKVIMKKRIYGKH